MKGYDTIRLLLGVISDFEYHFSGTFRELSHNSKVQNYDLIYPTFSYLTQPSLVQVPYPKSIEEYLSGEGLGLALFTAFICSSEQKYLP